ncbi:MULTISPECIES: hypothetical protein [unclassified Candidatus Tisiphia]|uniref:Bbp19 family protein n=1 Tax=unclassified Candidatus Tisiphia TaxID=2996318 RepID=UPI00312C9AF0
MKLSINSSSPPNLLTKEQLKSIYCKLFSGEDGKIILEDLAQMSGIYRSNFVRQESEYTAFLEGYLSFVPIYLLAGVKRWWY